MKKNIYILDNIDCAACGLKIEDRLNSVDGIKNSTLNFILKKLFVTFDETIINDEEVEREIHKSLRGIRIINKNNQPFVDEYQEENVFKKILFRGKRNV